MGSSGTLSYRRDGESRPHRVELDPFDIDIVAVTNDRFSAFVAATGYVTDAERAGWSFVFGGLLPDEFVPTRGVVEAPWWREVHGADWRHPEGPHSGLDGRGHHPVVQVSFRDAVAFCNWAEARLPSEAEWEYAARGGLAEATFPWGDELEPNGQHRMNVWQGSFPDANTGADGFLGTAPVDAYEPNGFGLYNMCGNVWEWCNDFFAVDAYRHHQPRNPTGPAQGDARVIRGGSYLCHRSYCHRYRVAARSANSSNSATGNMGFRTVRYEDPDRV